MKAVPFEVEDGVDEVFQNLRPRKLPTLGDVADKNNDEASGFRLLDQP